MVDQISANRGMHSRGHSHFELGAHSVRAGNEHRLFPFFAIQSEKRAKSADAAQHSRRERPASMVTDSLLRGIRQRNVHTGIGVFHEGPSSIRVWRGRTKVPVVLFLENALGRRGGVDSTLFRFAGDNQPKKSGTVSSSAPSRDGPAHSRKQKSARESGRVPKRREERRATYISSPACRLCLCAARNPKSGCRRNCRDCRPSRNNNCPEL